MEAWIIFSIIAAAFQTVRFMLQKYLSMGQMSAGGATFPAAARSGMVWLEEILLLGWHLTDPLIAAVVGLNSKEARKT